MKNKLTHDYVVSKSTLTQVFCLDYNSKVLVSQPPSYPHLLVPSFAFHFPLSASVQSTLHTSNT